MIHFVGLLPLTQYLTNYDFVIIILFGVSVFLLIQNIMLNDEIKDLRYSVKYLEGVIDSER